MRVFDIVFGVAAGLMLAVLGLGDEISPDRHAFLRDGAAGLLIAALIGQFLLAQRSKRAAHG